MRTIKDDTCGYSKVSHVAVLLAGFKATGDTKVIFHLIKGFIAKGISVDLVLASTVELSSDDLPEKVRVIDLQVPFTTRTRGALKLMPALIRYFRREKPKVFISNLSFTNAIVVLAKLFAIVPTKLVLVEHLALSKNYDRLDEPRSRLVPILMRLLYPFADAVVSGSHSMVNQLQADLKFKGKLKAIYNPVVDATLQQKAQESLDHPWLQPNQPPVFLAVGRFAAQKDFYTLIQAFALLRQQMQARLIILGEGGLRGRLESLIQELGLEAEVELPGYQPNPYRYMRRSTVFVLSSRWEVLPTALIEAMGCGCQVVATNCPYGVDEILVDGEYGQLVPIEDPIALAKAMKHAIEFPIRKEALEFRAAEFSVDRAVEQYLALIESL